MKQQRTGGCWVSSPGPCVKDACGWRACLCCCGLAPQPDLGQVSVLIHFPSPNSSSHCVPSSLSSAKLPCGLGSRGLSSDRPIAAGVLPHPKPCARTTVVTNPSLRLGTPFPLCLPDLPGTFLLLPPIPALTLSSCKRSHTKQALACLVNSFNMTEVGLVRWPSTNSLAAKLDDLSSTPEPRELVLASCLLTPTSALWHARAHPHTK